MHAELTIFSIPKPFAGHIGLIQRNALASWSRLAPEVDVILFGSDAGVAEAASEFGMRHEPEIAVNHHGTPLVSDAFARARKLSTRPHLLYSNTDILYNDSLLAALNSVQHLPAFLLTGQRWDLTITEDWVSAPASDWAALFVAYAARGHLHGPAGMDYFLFPRKCEFAMPEFAVGRVGWDSWLIWRARMTDVAVINATSDLIALHQNHDYSSLHLGCQHKRGPERDLNVRAAGGLSHLLTLREASYEIVNGVLQQPTGWRRITAFLATSAPYRWSLAGKRWLQQNKR